MTRAQALHLQYKKIAVNLNGKAVLIAQLSFPSVEPSWAYVVNLPFASKFGIKVLLTELKILN